MSVTYSDIIDASGRISPVINQTPVLESRTLNQLLTCSVYFKCENFQRIGAFKFRGAYHACVTLSPEQSQRGVITHSSGNHAQALSLAAKLLHIKATIVMPKGSPSVKINATRDTYGANVVLCENTIEDRTSVTQALIDQFGYTLIHPYDNDKVIAGQGTAAYDLLKVVPDLDIIIAPVGGGGLLSGSAISAKGFNKEIKVYGGEPERVDDAARSKKSGKIESNKRIDTIADGLRTGLSERTFRIIQKEVDEIITVSEMEIIEAMKFLWERMKIVVEPSGAVPLAVIFSKKLNVEGKKVGIILSGGNVDLTEFFKILESNITL
jgi:threonine dehydratase